MQLANITFRQIPILIAFATGTIALFTYMNTCSRPRAIEQAIRASSMPRLHWALVAEQPDCADIIRIFGGTE